jgi:hypothetical protein
MLAMCFGTRAGVLLRGAALLWCLRVCLATSPRGQQDQRLSTLRCRLRSALPSFQTRLKSIFLFIDYLTKSIFRLLRTYPEILPSAILGNSGQMVNSGLMVNSTKILSRFKTDFIGIKHWGVDCFAIQAKRSPPTLSPQGRRRGFGGLSGGLPERLRVGRELRRFPARRAAGTVLAPQRPSGRRRAR